MITEISMPSYVLQEGVLFLTLLVIGTSAVMPGIDRWSRRYFIAFFSVNALGMVVFIIDMLTYLNPHTLWLSNWLPFVEYIMFSLPVLVFTFSLIHYTGENWKKSILFYSVGILWVFYLILHIIAHYIDIFYYTSPDGHFYIKETHPWLYVPVIIMIILNLITVILRRKKLPPRYFIAFLFYLIPATIAMIIHALTFAVLVVNIAVCIGAFTMYILILTEQIDRYMKQQNAIADQKAKIMVLQMRPHFIYNTLTSIYYLCEQDSHKAQQVLLDLTSYLRKNFNAMVTSDTILFSEELEHIRAYLAVEAAQYEDSLMVEYDIPHTHFRLPPLTLQPLVENAIKHGMDPENEPLHIVIRTRENDEGSLILVEDNGPGFDPEGVFDSANALSNIKQRLEMMCHGTITIASNRGEGTKVVVFIPND